MTPAVRSGKIASVLSAYESTIEKNAESGDQCGMYLSNNVGNGGLGASRHSKDRSSRHRREQQQQQQQQHPRSPGKGGDRRSRSPVKGSEAKKAAMRLKKKAENMHSGRPRRTERPNHHDDDFFGDKKVPATLNFDSLTPSHAEKSRRSSDRSARTETTDELTIEDLEKGKSWNSFDASANFFSEAEGSGSIVMDGDNDCFSVVSESSFEKPDWNPEVKPKKKQEASWADGLVVAAHQQRGDESESDQERKKEKPRRKPRQVSRDLSSRRLQNNANPYQHRSDDNDSEDEAQEKKEKPRRKPSEQTSNRAMKKQGPASSFAITYRHRAEESDSDFDTTDMREKIRRKHLGQSALHQSGSNLVASFKLTRSSSARSLNEEDESIDMNNSISSLNPRALKAASLRQQAAGPGGFGSDGMGDNFRNMVMGGASNSNFSSSFLGNGSNFDLASESETSDAESGQRRKVRKSKPRPANGDASLSDASAFSSASKPKPVRKKKYGAAAAAENFDSLPPAFQTIMRKPAGGRKGERPRKPQDDSSRRVERKSRLSPKKTSDGGFADFANDNDAFEPFKADRSFFDCV